jgi:outer membrane protein assembly factor BamE (lipoprotein component of BamABCDE complex)
MSASCAKLAGALTGAIALAQVAACSPTVTNHGYRLDPEVLAQVTPGVSTREQVQRLLGSPSSIGTFDGERWYYISQRTEQMSFYQSEVTAQDVVTIDFDGQGIVREVGSRDLAQAVAVAPSSDKTRTMGNELTLLQQLLGNVGRFNTDNRDPLGRRTGP